MSAEADSDGRMHAGGLPLPWRVIVDGPAHAVLDDDGKLINMSSAYDLGGAFWLELVEDLNSMPATMKAVAECERLQAEAIARFDALETALVEVAKLFNEAGENDMARETAGIMIRETLTKLGLADRLPSIERDDD